MHERLARAPGVLSLLAGLVHAVMALDHVDFAADLAAFGAAATLQILWGAWALAAPHGLGRSALFGGAILQLACCAGWVVSRLVGLPFGQHAQQAQSIGLLDGGVVAVQVTAAAIAVALALGLRVGTRSAALITGALAVAATTVLAAGLVADGGHEHRPGEHHDDGHGEGHDPERGEHHDHGAEGDPGHGDQRDPGHDGQHEHEH